jgi:hypothetical protein
MQSFLSVAVWIWLAEIFPLHMRGLGIGIAVFAGWATNGFLALFFPALVEAIHINGVFFRFMVASAAPRSVPGRPGLGCLRRCAIAHGPPLDLRAPQRATPPQIPATSAEVGA